MHEYEKPVLESNEKFFVLDAHICFLENCYLKMKRDIKTIGNSFDISLIFQFHTRIRKVAYCKKK